MVENMSLKDVLIDMKKLDENKNPIPFKISVRSFNKKNKTGGKYTTYFNATLMQQGKNRSLTSLKEGKELKDPNHWKNKTRNLKIPDLSRPQKINILSIINYNGFNVVY